VYKLLVPVTTATVIVTLGVTGVDVTGVDTLREFAEFRVRASVGTGIAGMVVMALEFVSGEAELAGVLAKNMDATWLWK
jgi:hypothetical protein